MEGKIKFAFACILTLSSYVRFWFCYILEGRKTRKP